MKAVVVIPARFSAARLPGKPLLRESGKYLVEHVYERAVQAKRIDRVIVATDDARILEAVRSFGGEAVLTRVDHPSGTDRIAEAVETLDPEFDIVVNVQGDEPHMEPGHIDQLVELMETEPRGDAATLATPIHDSATWLDCNRVKVVADDSGRALYFSRAPIPYVRDGTPDFSSGKFLLHLGIYAYRRATLRLLAITAPHSLEMQEKLEQLRILGNGGIIRLGVVPHAAPGVDTPEDYQRFVSSLRS